MTKTWVVSRDNRRCYRRGYSHAHSRKILREMESGYRLWWEKQREVVVS